MKKRVVIGMSGGVDSSVAALLLKQEGHEVIALFMKNWDDPHSSCQAAADYEDVVRVCTLLDIPCYTVNFVEAYRELVFNRFLHELSLGYTPNPDIACNREIKFRLFMEKAGKLGADYVATGHYARIREGKLLKGVDPGKDQTYFLYTLKEPLLRRLLFPIGELTKPTVRHIAQTHRLPTATKKESMGICFIGKRPFRSFISSYLPWREGNFETLSGEVVGKHHGLPFYTIGQRKDLHIGGVVGKPGDPWFVVGKNVERNVVYVEQGTDHPSLYNSCLTAIQPSWIDEIPSFPFVCQAKIRYRQNDQECRVEKREGSQLSVSFSTPQRAITPGQAIVFYQDHLCLGGAVIAS